MVRLGHVVGPHRVESLGGWTWTCRHLILLQGKWHCRAQTEMASPLFHVASASAKIDSMFCQYVCSRPRLTVSCPDDAGDSAPWTMDGG